MVLGPTILFCLLLAWLFGPFLTVHNIRAFWENRVMRNTGLSRVEYLRWEKFFEERMTYFRALSMRGRAIFLRRTLRIFRDVPFRGMDGFQVTDEVRMLISASAVQLTFGLRNYSLSHLNSILVFEDTFYNRATHQWMKGAVSEGGHMALSWADFVDGYAVDTDNYNLGLHEMAHLLKLDAQYQRHTDDLFSGRLNKWFRYVATQMQWFCDLDRTFFRQYGCTNPNEFFAVSIEHFFESPEEFKATFPVLFNQMCVLLNQNPLHTHADYHPNPKPLADTREAKAD